MRLAWFLVIVGAAMSFTPIMLDPITAPINGLTILGILSMCLGAIRAVTYDRY